MGEQIRAWRAVASGWERRQETFRDATLALSKALVDAIDPQPGQTILELAAGLGDTGFLAAARLGATGRLLSTDVAHEMVEAAARRAAALGLENVEFAVADMAALELGDDSVDGILCRFGVMLVVDAGAACREMARVLRPGGRAALAVWAAADVNPWISATGREALELGFIDPPERDAPGPFRFADSKRLTPLLERAGLEVVSVEDVEVRWRAPSLDGWWDTILDTSRMLSVLVAGLDAGQVGRLRAAADSRMAQFVGSDGSLEAPGLARVVLAHVA